MAGYPLVTNWRRLPIRQDLKGNTDFPHFLGNGLGPQGIAILFIKLKGFFNSLRQFNAKLMRSLQITRVPLSHKRNDAVSFLKDRWYPPVKGWFMVNAKYLCIFGCFNRVRLLKVSNVFPRCGAVPPLAAKLLTNGRAL